MASALFYEENTLVFTSLSQTIYFMSIHGSFVTYFQSNKLATPRRPNVIFVHGIMHQWSVLWQRINNHQRNLVKTQQLSSLFFTVTQIPEPATFCRIGYCVSYDA